MPGSTASALTNASKTSCVESGCQQLNDDERLSLAVVDFVDRADVRMIQSGCRLRLALETGQHLRVSGNLLRKKLESNEAVQPGYPRPCRPRPCRRHRASR